jgi:prolyl oligopeptidase
MHVTDKQVPEDTLADIEFSTLSWKSNEGIFYNKYDYSKQNASLSSSFRGKTDPPELRFHKLGTKQSEDIVVPEGQPTN